MGQLLPSYSTQQLVAEGKFSTADLRKIQSYRGHHNRLGFAYQLIFVRVFNFFPKQKPLEVIDEIITFAALQLNSDKKYLVEYCKHQQHIARHQEHIKSYLRLLPYNEKYTKKLRDYIFNEAQRVDQIAFLLSEAKYFLKNHRILQPVDNTLQRLAINERERARTFIFSKVMSLLDEKLIHKLDNLLIVETSRISKLQYLKKPPAAPSVKSLLELIRKLELVQETQVLEINLEWLNNNYQRSLAKYVNRSSAHRLKELHLHHRYTALVCFLRQVNQDTIDYMVEMHFKIITTVYASAENKIGTKLQEKRKSIKKSLTMLTTIGGILLDEEVPNENLRSTIFEQVERTELQTQLQDSSVWLSGKYSHVFKLIIKRFNYLRRFAPGLIEHLQFTAESSKSESLVKAVNPRICS